MTDVPDGRIFVTERDGRLHVIDTIYQMRFLGDPAHKGTIFKSVQVRSRAYPSRPVAPSKVKKGGRFTVYGYLKPYHSGRTQLSFYHYRNGKWRFYKTVYADNRRYNGFTRYIRRYKLPYTGRWYIRAYHGDRSHATTWSPREVLRVVKQRPGVCPGDGKLDPWTINTSI